LKSIIIWYNTLFEDAWWTYKFISVYRCKCVGVSMKRSVVIQTNDCGSSQKLWERDTHTQMAHDPNRFMKGFAFVRESWRGCMRCSPWLAKEMSTDSPIVKTGARKIAGRTWGPVRRFLTRALFSLPCCLRSADVTLRGISHRSAAPTLITLDLDGWFSSGGCSKSYVESQMQDANPFESIRIIRFIRHVMRFQGSSWDARHGEGGCQVPKHGVTVFLEPEIFENLLSIFHIFPYLSIIFRSVAFRSEANVPWMQVMLCFQGVTQTSCVSALPRSTERSLYLATQGCVFPL
jgi:hypothetical protein